MRLLPILSPWGPPLNKDYNGLSLLNLRTAPVEGAVLFFAHAFLLASSYLANWLGENLSILAGHILPLCQKRNRTTVIKIGHIAKSNRDNFHLIIP